MLPASGAILALAFVLGLLATVVPWGGIGVLLLGISGGIWRWCLPRFWRTGPPPILWFVAGGIGLLASLYFQMRLPQPAPNDISRVIPDLTAAQNPIVRVEGRVESLPRRTRKQRIQLWLQVDRYELPEPVAGLTGKGVTGRLYLTTPAADLPDLYPSQAIAVEGRLYQPSPATNPRGFDFQKYLATQGAFAGMNGTKVTVLQPGNPWGRWAIRQRIVRSQQAGLGDLAGPLVSAMVLGARAVDLPFSVREAFSRVGLAHALAASGFHTSLLLGMVLSLVRGVGVMGKLVAGSVSLITYAGLSGFEPSIARATLMGIAGLLSLVMGRKAKPVGILLLVVVLLLLLNPLWIWQLGFQLSVLATLGLIVTVPALTARFTVLPPAIATMVAVPLAASLWTLPLQLAVFGVFPLYGVVVNAITNPLLSLITIGGFISAAGSLVWPLGGSLLAWLLYYPAHLLLWIVNFFNQLPGSSLAVGSIGIWQILLLYGLLICLWLWPWWQRRWGLAGILALGLILVPVWQTKLRTFQVTILDTVGLPVLVIQQPQATTLINSGDATTASLTVRSFLQQQGINQIDWAIATNTSSRYQEGWLNILRHFSVKTFSNLNPASSRGPSADLASKLNRDRVASLPLELNQTVTVAATELTCLRADPLVLQLKIKDQNWLLLTDPRGAGQKIWLETAQLPAVQVLWWFGKNFSLDIVRVVQPKIVILSSRSIEPEVLAQLQAEKVQIYWTGRDGAVQWTPERGFETTLDGAEGNTSLL